MRVASGVVARLGREPNVMDGIVCPAAGGPTPPVLMLTCSASECISGNLAEAVRDAGDRGTRWIVFDLRAGTSCDSRAVGALLLAHRLCARNNGWVTLLGPSPSTRALLDAIGIADLFQVSDDYDTLMAELGGLVVPHRKERL